MLTIDKSAPEELNYRPFKGAYSVGEIILHIAHEEEIEVHYGLARRRGALRPAPALPDKATPASLKAVLEAIHREMELVLRSLDDGQFAASYR